MGATRVPRWLVAATLGCTAPSSAEAQAQATNAASTSAPVAVCDFAEIDNSDILGVVIFPELSDNLQASDRKILTAVLGSAKAAGYAKLLLVGFADQAGSPSLNLRLGGRRAGAAAEYLAPAAAPILLKTMTCGEDRPILPTDGSGHAHNRRVEIRGLR